MGHTSCHHTRLCSYTQARIASRNYPKPYFSRGSKCTWLITSAERTYISMTILDFDLPTFDECLSTSLSIFDGESTDYEQIGSYCNYHRPPGIIKSGFNEVFVQFSSGASEERGRGFLIEYQTEMYIIVNRTLVQPGTHYLLIDTTL